MAEMTRRNFFGKVIGAIAGLIGVVLAVPLLGFAVLPAFRKREAVWSEAGPLWELDVNRPKEFEIVRTISSGWMRTNSVRSIWAFRTEKGEVVVYSPICPHLGCGYHWEEEEKKFFCPCHDSVFDLDGKVLAGPAPRPLDTLPIKVEENRLFVLYQEFRVGTPKKQEI